MHDAQPSKDGQWFNHSFLIYCPDENSEPCIVENDTPGFMLKYTNIDEPFQYTIALLCPAKVRHMYINEEGFVITKANWKPIEPTQYIDKSVDVESDLSVKLKEALQV
jgi:hypothetical protein